MLHSRLVAKYGYSAKSSKKKFLCVSLYCLMYWVHWDSPTEQCSLPRSLVERDNHVGKVSQWLSPCDLPWYRVTQSLFGSQTGRLQPSLFGQFGWQDLMTAVDHVCSVFINFVYSGLRRNMYCFLPTMAVNWAFGDSIDSPASVWLPRTNTLASPVLFYFYFFNRMFLLPRANAKESECRMTLILAPNALWRGPTLEWQSFLGSNVEANANNSVPNKIWEHTEMSR